jgi:hypothetical protein
MALAVGGCDYLPFGYTAIRDINARPAEFDGREVKIRGRVTGGAQMLGFKAYALGDRGGEIGVLTRGELPAIDANVAIRGVVKSAVIIGGTTAGLRVEETQRLR